MADIRIENARIIFRNFEGAKDDFNAEGKRNFHVVLTEDQANELREIGVNVKIRAPREEGDEPTYHAKVNVNLESNYPPKVYLVTETENGELKNVRLDAESISCLDTAYFKEVHLELEQYEYKPGRVSLYLRTGYFLINQEAEWNPFAGRYE